MAETPSTVDVLKAKFRDGNVFNRHKNLGLSGNDSFILYYKTKLALLSLSVTGSINDLMSRYWNAYIRTGSSTGVSGQSVGNGTSSDNTIASLGSTTSLIGITSVIGANQSAVVNYVYQDIGWKVSDLEYSLDGGVSWSLVPTKPFTTSFTATVAPTSRTTTITDLTNGQLYSISLRAVDFYTPTESFVPAAAPMPVRPNVSAVPDAPTNLTVTKTQTTATVGFDLPASGTSAITNYQYSLDGGSTWSNVASYDLFGATVSGLTAGTKYSICVRAVNAVGSGTASSSISVTTSSAASTPAFRSSSTATSTSGTLTTPMPTGVVSGDILVFCVWVFFDAKTGNAGSSILTGLTGWTLRGLANSLSGDGYAFAVYTKTAGASESSVVWAGGTNWKTAQGSVTAISGGTAVDVVSTISGLSVASVTTTSATDLLVGAWVAESSSDKPITVPASMTSRVALASNNAGFFANMSIGTETLSATGSTGTRTATNAGGQYYVIGMLLAVK